MPITDAQKANLETLREAFAAGSVGLMECAYAESGDPVVVLCTFQMKEEGDMISVVPFAKLFMGNPYEELLPPKENPS